MGLTDKLTNRSHRGAMNLSQVRYFLALYQELNFTRAAKRCGVSQPSLTNGIKNLERRFGGQLFYRIRSSQSQTRPTDLANALKAHLKRMNDSARQAEKIAEQLLVAASTKNECPCFIHEHQLNIRSQSSVAQCYQKSRDQ
jgi:hypothetical protein